jgi:hypothetical protein
MAALGRKGGHLVKPRPFAQPPRIARRTLKTAADAGGRRIERVNQGSDVASAARIAQGCR